jgi:hypothetical protein
LALILIAASFLGILIGLFFRVPALLVATLAAIGGYGVIWIIDQPTLRQGLINLLELVAVLQISYVAGVGISVLLRRRR